MSKRTSEKISSFLWPVTGNAPQTKGAFLKVLFIMPSFESNQIGWILALGLSALVFLLIREWRKAKGARKYLRMGLISAALISLMMAGGRPVRIQKVDPNAAIILTEGANPTVVDSLRQLLNPQLVAAVDSSLSSIFPESQYLPYAGYLQEQFPLIQRIHLVGDGLPAAQLEQWSGKSVVYHCGEPPSGIVEFYYEPQITEGEQLLFRGVYRQTEQALRRLYLNGPHGSILLLDQEAPGIYQFSGEVPAQQQGTYVLELVEEGVRREVLSREPVPLVIRAAQPIRVLILNDAPRFETNYLKNWIADAGYPVAVRTTISRDKFYEAFYNLPEKNLQPLTKALLGTFDLLLIDGEALATLRRTERAALRRAIQEGLGLCLLSRAELPSLSAAEQRFFLDFPRRTAAPVFLPEGADVELSKAPYKLEDEFGIFPIAQSRSGNIIAGFRLRGEGRIALQLAYDTYRLLLSGKENAYRRWWTDLLEKVARQPLDQAEWIVADPLLLQPDAPVHLQLITGLEHPEGLLSSSDSMQAPFYFRQTPLLPERWSATVWPQHRGWQRLALRDQLQDSSWIYVASPGRWSSLHRSRVRQATAIWMAQQPAQTEIATTQIPRKHPYPLWWFYVLFLLSAGALWLEEKW